MKIIIAFITSIAVSVSQAQTTVTISHRALENLVALSANAQDKWSVVNPSNIGDTTSVVALDYTLDIAAIAQHTSRHYGTEILATMDKNSCTYADLAFRYAKYSNCSISQKITLLEDILSVSRENCDRYVIVYAALELLKLSTSETSRTEALAKQFVIDLVAIKQRNVDVAQYWRLLLEIKSHIVIDDRIAHLVSKYFSKELINDMEEAKNRLIEDPNFYGVQLISNEMYQYVPRHIRIFWCGIWQCCEGLVSK